jgi:hypothetical protein
VKALLAALEVAQDLPTAEDSFAKAAVDDPAATIARALLAYVSDLRHDPKTRLPAMQVDATVERARALTKLSKDAAPDWWAVAEDALRETYGPHFEAVPELDSLAPASRKFPARRRAHIVRTLRSRFVAMAKP